MPDSELQELNLSTLNQSNLTGQPVSDPGRDFIAPQTPEPEDEMAACAGKRIAILIVAYNAVTTLKSVLNRISRPVWKAVESVVIFDDASQDATYELAIGYQALQQNSKLHVIKNPVNLGYGGTQMAAYRYLIEQGFDIVVLLHGDGQYAPELLPHLYHPIVAGEADAVFGSRIMGTFGGPLRGGMPLYKYIGNRILSWYENRALGMHLTEFHSGYRAYSLAALREIDFSAMTQDYHFDTQMIVKLHHQGFRIREVPIPTYYGNEIRYVNGLTYAHNVVRAVRRYRQTIRSRRRAPEFAEYFIRYPLKESKYSSHYYFQQFLAGGKQDILELGCGEGFFVQSVALYGHRITGIDILPEPKHVDAFERYICADLSKGLPDLEGRKFHKVLLMDVLEHVAHPELVLRDCRAVLKPNGAILVCVPNVANISVRLALLFGRFTYTERGILDRTHLRFFTARSARHLLEESGYEIASQTVTVIPAELVFGLPAANFFAVAINRILAFLTRIFPGLLGYQYILVARASGGARNVPGK